jgi:hypothetical protein
MKKPSKRYTCYGTCYCDHTQEDSKMIGQKLSTTRNGVQSAPNTIGLKLSTPQSEVQEVLHQMSTMVIEDSLLNLKIGVSSTILLAQTMITI